MSIVVIWNGFAFWPSMTRVASEMKLQFMVLEMKGKEREALRESDAVARRALRHRRASSPSEKAMGGLWSNFEPIRGVPQSRGSLATRTLSHGHDDGVSTRRHRCDFINTTTSR